MSSRGTSRLYGDSDAVTPSSYSVSSIIIETNKGEEIDINNLVNNFTFTESLDKSYIECFVQMTDATNFLEEKQINGNEKITFTISRSPFKDSEKDKIKWQLSMRISEVNGYVRTKAVRQNYRLYCVSEHMYINASKVLVRPFENTIGGLIDKICKADLKIEPHKINTSSKATIKGIYPRMRPIQAIKWLMRNAYEDNTPFYFYESIANGVSFESYKKLLDEEVYETYEFRPQFKHSLGTPESYDEVRRRIRKIIGDFGMPKLNQMLKGAYASTLHTVDIANKKYEINTFGYKELETLNKHKHWSDNHKVLDKTYDTLFDSKNHYVSLNTKAFDLDNYHQPAFPTLLKGEAYKQALEFNDFKITIPGDFEMCVGKKIDLEIIKTSTTEHLEEEGGFIDKYLSGTYIVTSITHTFDQEFVQTLNVKRDSIGVDINA